MINKALIKLADKFAHKYAGNVQEEVHTALHNASLNEGTRKIYNLIPFIQMINEDQVTLSFDVEKNGNTVSVTNVRILPFDRSDLAKKYEPLIPAVKKYLELQQVYSVPEFKLHLEYTPDNKPAS